MDAAVSRPLRKSLRLPQRADATRRNHGGYRTPVSPRPLGRRPSSGLSRRRLATLAGAVVVAWIVVVFARAVADSAGSTARADTVRRDTTAAAAELVAEQVELVLIQTPAFVRLQARAYGYGLPGEQAFALEPGGTSAAVITPLGEDPAGARPRSPLEAWLQLIFGP